MKVRKGRVKLDGQMVGTIEESGGTVTFTYAAEWLKQGGAPVSLTLPLRREPYVSRGLHPFFDNLLPEGWFLEIALKKLKLARDDAFGMLLATCGDCVGAVAIEPANDGIGD